MDENMSVSYDKNEHRWVAQNGDEIYYSYDGITWIPKEKKMKILTNNNVAFAKGEKIEKGRWENDSSMDTYRIKDGNNYQYAVIADFVLHEVESVPEDFKPNKYCYTESEGFYLNPYYEEPVSEEYSSGYDQAVLDMIESGVL